jgi:hypothetical protein
MRRKGSWGNGNELWYELGKEDPRARGGERYLLVGGRATDDACTLHARLAWGLRRLWLWIQARPLLAAISISLILILVLGTAIALLPYGQDVPAGAAGHHATGAASATSLGPSTLALPVSMPDHFAFGLMNGPGDVALMNDMRARNGAAWDFRYQYLAGGVNTGHGWETWNTPTGAFATYYLRDSTDNGYLPAFVYYELLQSNGQCGTCPDSQRDLINLNTPSVMVAYYANWRLLMQKIAATDKPALVIVEPDLWGYLQQASATDGADGVPASVASSGDHDAAGLPNTAQGFAWALLRFRDRYAPNALLALHISNWATGIDLNSNTDPALDVAGLARDTATFALSAGLRGNPQGISTWDLLSNDVADRDSGQGNAWWDRTNQEFPNFTRYLSFVSALTAATGRHVVMWQVPEGNQYFATMNDTHRHTQDNRPEYILGHVADFARVGVAAVLFGPGNDGTTVDDADHDGVTNPAPISSFQCDRCNTHLSAYPDDDGGYLRLFVGAYYRHGPLPLANPTAWTPPAAPNNSPTVTPVPVGTCQLTPQATIGQVTVTPNPAAPGHQITVTAYITLSCNTAAAVEYDVYQGGNVTIILKLAEKHESFLAGQTRAISITGTLPASTQPGSHAITAGVFSTTWNREYGFESYAAALQVSS